MRNLVIQVPGMGAAALWLATAMTDRVVTPGDKPEEPIASAQATASAPSPRGH